MELIRALSNRGVPEKLERLNDCRKRLLQDAPYDMPATNPPPARAGDITRAAVAVLAKAGQPMKVSEVQSAVEDLLGRPINRQSLKGCLSKGALAANPRFQRTKRAYYRLV